MGEKNEEIMVRNVIWREWTLRDEGGALCDGPTDRSDHGCSIDYGSREEAEAKMREWASATPSSPSSARAGASSIGSSGSASRRRREGGTDGTPALTRRKERNVNAREKRGFSEWIRQKTADKGSSDAEFEALRDMGAALDPDGRRSCCIEAAVKQVLENGTEEDVAIALQRYAYGWRLRGEHDCMTDLLAKLA